LFNENDIMILPIWCSSEINSMLFIYTCTVSTCLPGKWEAQGAHSRWAVQGTHCHCHSIQLSFPFWLHHLQNTSLLNLTSSTTGSSIPSSYKFVVAKRKCFHFVYSQKESDELVDRRVVSINIYSLLMCSRGWKGQDSEFRTG
jgi:hypothetical protein